MNAVTFNTKPALCIYQLNNWSRSKGKQVRLNNYWKQKERRGLRSQSTDTNQHEVEFRKERRVRYEILINHVYNPSRI